MARTKKPRAERRALISMPLPKYDFGANLQASIKLFGEKAVHTLFVSAATQQLRDYTKQCLNRTRNPMTPEQVEEACGSWKPGERTRTKATAAKVEKLVGAMSADDREELLKKLLASKPGAEGSDVDETESS